MAFDLLKSLTDLYKRCEGEGDNQLKKKRDCKE